MSLKIAILLLLLLLLFLKSIKLINIGYKYSNIQQMHNMS